MEITITQTDGVQVVCASGRIQMTDSDQFEKAIRQPDISTQFVLDLSNTTYMCSMALGALIACKRRIMRAGGEMRIVVLPGDVLDVLRLTMIDKVIQVEESVNQAIKSFH